MANDITIIGTILGIFVMLSLFLPFIQADFGEIQTSNSVDSLIDADDSDDLTDVSAWELIKSFFKVFFWSFGTFPFWLEGILGVMKLVLIITVARNIWVGGGG